MSGAAVHVLIAGGTGFVGEALRTRLRDAGIQVKLLVRSSADARHYQQMGFETEFGDVGDPQSLFVAMSDVDAVINLVAIVRERGDATFERINFQGTVNLVNAARQAHVDRFVQMSALGAGNLPDFPYHYTKWRAETYVQDRIPKWTIIRPSIVYGPSAEGNFQFVSQLADLFRMGPVVPVPGDGRALFQPIHTEDLAAAFTAVINDASTSGGIYELGGPDVLTYREMLDAVAEALGSNKRIVNIPVPLIRLGVRIMNPIPFVQAPVTNDQLDMLQIDNTTDRNAAPDLIGRPLKVFRDELGFLETGNHQANVMSG